MILFTWELHHFMNMEVLLQLQRVKNCSRDGGAFLILIKLLPLYTQRILPIKLQELRTEA